VYDHCAQLIATLRAKGLKPTVLVLQTDGGPDHSLKRLATKLALIAMFKDIDLDHLVVLRCAPNGSAMNKVERSMSVLNIPLAHVALKRGEMPAWAEEAVKNCNSMASVRVVAEKEDAKQQKALQDVVALAKELNDFLVAEVAVPVVAPVAAEVKVIAKVRDGVDSSMATESIVQNVVSVMTACSMKLTRVSETFVCLSCCYYSDELPWAGNTAQQSKQCCCCDGNGGRNSCHP